MVRLYQAVGPAGQVGGLAEAGPGFPVQPADQSIRPERERESGSLQRVHWPRANTANPRNPPCCLVLQPKLMLLQYHLKLDADSICSCPPGRLYDTSGTYMQCNSSSQQTDACQCHLQIRPSASADSQNDETSADSQNDEKLEKKFDEQSG